jgi:peptide/nickel transport system substrate-binding protein/oligopeptide transport system substrate-binding protein
MALLVFSCTPENRVPGYVYYRIAASPFTLDPAMITDVTGGTIAAKLFGGLVRIGNGLSIVPDIARGWSVSADGRVYTFWLKKGVRFSNGREVTSEDFKYSFERVMRKETASPNRWALERIEGAAEFFEGRAAGISGIDTPDPYTLNITLSEPFSPFLNLLATTAAYVVPKEAAQDKDAFSSNPAGSGPFVLESPGGASAWGMSTWGREVRLRARKDYFEGPPKVEGIIYRVIPEDLTTVVEFEIGNLDVISVPASVYSRFKKDPEWKGLMAGAEGINTYYLGLNCSRPPLSDPRVRRAVSHAIDRRKILETFLEGRGVFATGPVPPSLRGWPAPPPYEYDPEKAKRLLSEAGYEKGLRLTFYVTAQEEVADMAEIIQSYLRKAGIEAELRQLEWNTYREAINKAEPDMFWISWWADYPDPENFLFPLFHSSNHGAAGNRTRYTNPEVDRLIKAGQRARSKEERDRHYRQAEELIVSDSPWVFFWHRKDVTLRHPRVKNYNMFPVYSMDKGTEVSLN